MMLTGLDFASALTVAGALAGALAVLYLLKLRRRRITVPFTPLWSRVLMDREASSWLQRLKRLLSLLLWILVMLLIVAALTDPQPEQELERGRSVLLLIDTSASMAATEPALHKTRFQLAAEKAREFIDELGPHDKVMIMTVDGQVRSLTGDFTDNEATLREALEQAKPTATEAQLDDGLRTAVDTLLGRRDPHLIFISDGAHPTLYEDVPLDPGEVAATVPNAPATEPALPETDPDAPAAEPQPGEPESAPAAVVDAATALGDEAREPAPTTKRVFKLPDGLLRKEITFEHVLVGEAKGNVAVTGFNIRRYISNKLDYEVYIQVRNFFDREVRVELTLYNLLPDEDADGGFYHKAIEKRSLDIGPGSRELRFYKDLPLASDHLGVKVELKSPGLVDALALDNEAFVLVPRFRQAKVLVVTPGNLFLEAALLLNENFDVEVMAPGDPFLHPDGSAVINLAGLRKQPYDVVVFDNSVYEDGDVPIAPDPSVAGNYLYINPKGESSPFKVRDIKQPLVERIDRKHPIARWLVLKDLNMLRGSAIRTKSGDRVVVRGVDGALVVARREGGSRLVGMGFSLIESDIVFRVALPVLLINAIDWFLDESNSLIQAYRTGQNWHVPVPIGLSEVDIRDPSGNLDRGVPTHNGKVVYYGANTGFYALSPASEASRPAGTPDTWEVAANFSSPRESNIEPARAPLDAQEGVKAELAATHEKDPRLERWAWLLEYFTYDLWLYCVFAVMGLLLVEWFTYHRRWTV